MPVDIRDVREQRLREAKERGDGQTATPPPLPATAVKVDFSEYITENEFYNDLVRRCEPRAQQMLDAQNDSKDKLVGLLNDQGVRGEQVKYWIHKGIEQGLREAMLVIKQIEIEKKQIRV